MPATGVPMKFGVSLFPLRPQQIIDVALQSEALGFDSLWLGEHVVTVMESASRFPYAGGTDDSHDAFHGNLPFYDAYAVLGYLAAITKRVKLVVSVSIVPLHDPFHLARSVTTLDLFSGGRFVFGAGGGWLKEEFEVLGRDFESRGKRFDETLDVMVRLFNEEVTEYSGAIFKVPAVGMSPKPQTRPHPPFVFGGHSKAALRRAAFRGDGWLASELSPEEIAPAIRRLEEMRAQAGRAETPFEVSCAVMGNIDEAKVARYAAAGVHRLVVRPWMRGRDAVENLAKLAERLL